MKPELRLRSQFEEVLDNYTISQESQSMLNTLELIVMFAPTSAGRNTIIEKLKQTGNYDHVVSDTTRPMREKDGQVIERNGVEYFFRSEEQILSDLKAGKFLEAAIIHNQQVSGTSIRELERVKNEGKMPILEIQQDGVHVIYREKPDTNFIFLIPPSFDEWMRRLKNRSDMSVDEIQNRLKSAEVEFEDALSKDYYKYVINDDVAKATQKIRNIVEKNEYLQTDHEAAKALIEELLTEAKKHIQ